MADSFKITYKDNTPYKTEDYTNTNCFYKLNTAVQEQLDSIKTITIVVEQAKVKDYSQEYVDCFFENINKIGGVPFTLEKIGEDYHLHLDVSYVKRSIDTLYISTAIRCLYDEYRSDFYKYIGKHFVKLCTYFPEEDKGKLYTIASNCYVFNLPKVIVASSYGFNTNHSIMCKKGCTVLTTEEIKERLKKNTYIHNIFMAECYENPAVEKRYKTPIVEGTKEEYSKLFE